MLEAIIKRRACRSFDKEKEVEPIREEFNITYDLDGGAFLADYPTIIKKGEELILCSPVKEGFNFLGWVLDGGSEFVSSLSDVESDIKLVAKWEEIIIIPKYTITYESLGEANLPYETLFEYEKGTEYTLPIISQDDYNFLGWSLDPDGLNMITKIDASMEGDLVLYANWEYVFVTYEMEYDLDGGELIEEVKYTYNEGECFYLPKIKKDGYRFLGWTYSKGSTDYITDIIYVTGNFKFYANFEKRVEGEYLIDYVYEDGRYITHTATSPEEFIDQFWKEFYEWCNPGITLEKFIEANMASWKNGNTSKYNLYPQSGKGEISSPAKRILITLH